MSKGILSGTLVFHRWDSGQGLMERYIDFDSLEQMFSRCLHPAPEETLDRVVLDGLDASGIRHQLTLAFQSEES